MCGGAEFHYNVADLSGKARIADQGDEEILLLRHAVHVAQADQGVFFKGSEYAVDGGTDGWRRPTWRLSARHGRDGKHHQRGHGDSRSHRSSRSVLSSSYGRR